MLEPSIAVHIKSLGDVRNVIALARLELAYVLRVGQLERQLYEHLFSVERADAMNERSADDDVVTTFNSKNTTASNRRLHSSSFSNSNSAAGAPRSGDETLRSSWSCALG